MNKAVLIFFIFLASCAPQVTVTSEVTVTLTTTALAPRLSYAAGLTEAQIAFIESKKGRDLQEALQNYLTYWTDPNVAVFAPGVEVNTLSLA